MESFSGTSDQPRPHSVSAPLKPTDKSVLEPVHSDGTQIQLENNLSATHHSTGQLPDSDKYRSTTGTPSTSSSVDSTIADIHESKESHTSILLPETKVEFETETDDTKVDRRHDYRDKAFDYSRQIMRFIKSVLVVTLFLVCTLILFYCLGKDLSQTKTLVSILAIAVGMSCYYLFFSTFKSWFYYWDPEFTWNKPS